MAGRLGNLTGAAVTLPDEIKTAIDEVGFLVSIPLWLVTILGSVFITVLSFVMILTVYSRFFRLYMYTALAPIPLSTFAGESTSNTGNGNGFILDVSGSGKSFAAKEEITSIALSTDDDILIVDPEREYAPLVRALGGEVVQISAGSPNHINAMDMASGYGEVDGKTENPLILKSQFIMSLCEQLMKPEVVGAKEKSIIGRCVGNVYRDYIKNYENPPTLKEFREELLRQPEPQAQSIALALELFTDGSLNVFAHQTNVNMNNRIMLFDIFDLGSQLKTVGMLVICYAKSSGI